MQHHLTNQTNRGFTLIELLVVMFIIGLVIAAATITLGDNQGKRLEQKSKQLAALIDLAKEQAIFNTEELGMLFTKDAYSFYRLNTENQDENIWEQIQDDKLLSDRALPDGLEFDLFLEGVKVTYSKKEIVTPQVYILSDGSVTSFRVEITDRIDHAYSLKVAENGTFEFNAVN